MSHEGIGMTFFWPENPILYDPYYVVHGKEKKASYG